MLGSRVRSRALAWVVGVGLVGLLACASAWAATSAWGNAQEIPGTAALNVDAGAGFDGLSCASAGNCAAGGFYFDGNGHYQAFVVDEVSGTWGDAVEVPGTATLNAGGNDQVSSVSCASAGNCAAGGLYMDGGNSQQAFVVDEVNGTWDTAVEVPGTAALNVYATSGAMGITSVSCSSAGNCAAGGQYEDSSGSDQAFIVDETNGTWGSAVEVPGTAALNLHANSRANGITSVSCASAGNCAAGGQYEDSSGSDQAFIVDETNGTWGSAVEVPETSTLNTGGNAQVNSVSCTSAGNCTAGGQYKHGDFTEAFVADESGGTWGNAQEVPGTAALNAGGAALVNSVSCTSAGNCSAGGQYRDSNGNYQAFVVDESGGTWGNAQEVPGTAALNVGNHADAHVATNSVSCASAGNCSAGGLYQDSGGNEQAFVVDEVGGVWDNAQELPGTATLNNANARVNLVSCGAIGSCAAGGFYETNRVGSVQVFVADYGASGSSGGGGGGGAGGGAGGGGTGGPSPAVTTVTLTASVNASQVAQPVTLTATVSPTPSTGTISFTDAGVALPGCAAVPVNTSTGQATCTTSFSTPGSHLLRASYFADSADLGVQSLPLTEVVSQTSTPTPTQKQKPTSLHVSASPHPAIIGHQVALTARVNPRPNGGHVSFTQNGHLIPGCGDLSVGRSGTVTCKWTPKQAGRYVIRVAYLGTSAFANSHTSMVSQVNKPKHSH